MGIKYQVTYFGGECNLPRRGECVIRLVPDPHKDDTSVGNCDILIPGSRHLRLWHCGKHSDIGCSDPWSVRWWSLCLSQRSVHFRPFKSGLHPSNMPSPLSCV